MSNKNPESIALLNHLKEMIASKPALDVRKGKPEDLEADMAAHREILAQFVLGRNDPQCIALEVAFTKKERDLLKNELKARANAKKLSLKEHHSIPTAALKKAYDVYREDASNAKFAKDMHGVTFDESLVQSKTILSVRHLKQFFGSGPYKTKAVHDVSFDIQEGECFGLVGESGCGKTTTGRTVIGLYKPTGGAIYYKGYRIAVGTRWNQKEIKWSRIHAAEEIKKLTEAYRSETSDVSNPDELEAMKARYEEKVAKIKADLAQHVAEQKALIKGMEYDNSHSSVKLRNEIQMIFQDPIDSLDPRMTVEDIITEGLHIQGNYDRAENHAIVEEALKKVGLIPEYASRYPHEFSGGQRQRIGIARAMVMNPKVLICDEPISALDVSIRAQVLNLLNKLKQEMGLTMIFIAHDLSVVKYFCDRIAVMYFGNMVELATSDELFAHPLHPYTRALLSAIPKPDPLSEKKRTRIVYNPVTTHDYSEHKPTFREILPGHFVLCNDEEEAKYKEEILAMDKEAKSV